MGKKQTEYAQVARIRRKNGGCSRMVAIVVSICAACVSLFFGSGVIWKLVDYTNRITKLETKVESTEKITLLMVQNLEGTFSDVKNSICTINHRIDDIYSVVSKKGAKAPLKD
jgi:hypothetical protein